MVWGVVGGAVKQVGQEGQLCTYYKIIVFRFAVVFTSKHHTHQELSGDGRKLAHSYTAKYSY